jgi:hypothetical protein
MLINLSYFAPFVLHAFILKPFTVTINDLCHDSHVCFLLFLLLFLRQLSLCFYVTCLSISTSLWFDRRHVLLTCLLLYVVRIFILF